MRLELANEGATKKSDLNDKDMLDVNDTGGQPMFHEVLPVFIQNTMLGVLIVKLNEPLDSFPLVKFYTSSECSSANKAKIIA